MTNNKHNKSVPPQAKDIKVRASLTLTMPQGDRHNSKIEREGTESEAQQIGVSSKDKMLTPKIDNLPFAIVENIISFAEGGNIATCPYCMYLLNKKCIDQLLVMALLKYGSLL